MNTPLATAVLGVLLASPLLASTAADAPTYGRDVAPILARHCVSCHAPGQIGPMSLLSYEEVRPWAKSMAKAVASGSMPPWHAVGGTLAFRNDRSLDPRERETLLRWVAAGAPEGEPVDPIPAPPSAGDWQLGEPDLVLELGAMEVPAAGADRFENIVVPTGFQEERWVSAIEVLPGRRDVVHHVLLWFGTPDGKLQQGLLGGWAAGADPMVFSPGTAKRLPPASALIGDLHYHPNGTAGSDSTRIGVHFASPDEVERELRTVWVLDAEFEIPAGDSRYGSSASYTFAEPVRIHGLLPHLHYRGKDMTFTAFYPDGTAEELLRVRYDFAWQTRYELAEPRELPAGTRLEVVAHWDNSAANADNPDPSRSVRWGPQSTDEMLIGFVDYTAVEGKHPRPVSLVMGKLPELVAKYPRDVWVLEAPGPSGMPPQKVALRLPHDGERGAWYLPLPTAAFPAPVEDVRWQGENVAARIDFDGLRALLGDASPGGSVELVGRLDPKSRRLEVTLAQPDGKVTVTAIPAEELLDRSASGSR